jgi:hypothetical protein
VGSAANKTLYAGFLSKPWVWASILDGDITEILTDRLFQNFPNPFGRSTTIGYTLARDGHIEITVFNVNGQRVKTLISEQRHAGRHSAIWHGLDEHGRRVSPGVYFYRMTLGGYRSVKKMLVLR